MKNLAHIDAAAFALHPCDITDEAATADLIRRVQPTHVFHLAAYSYVPTSWEAPHATLTANVLGTLNLLEAVRRYAPAARFQFSGSSEEYGRVEADECPITEDQPLRPLSPYGVSKVAADLLSRQYAASYGLHIVVTRAHNHTGPRRGHVFAESDWARQLAMIERGEQEPFIAHGNLDAVRDYTDVRDIVRGYVLALENGKSGAVYNLCSGAGASLAMRWVLRDLVALSRVNVELRPDPRRMRPSDVPRLIGDAAKAKRELGWAPKIPLAQTWTDLISFWRSDLHATGSKISEPI